jgi:hypothetical protein
MDKSAQKNPAGQNLTRETNPKQDAAAAAPTTQTVTSSTQSGATSVTKSADTGSGGDVPGTANEDQKGSSSLGGPGSGQSED